MTLILWLLVGAVVWLLIAAPVAVAMGRVIHLADRTERRVP